MSLELLIFVGYSQDARDEALAICELKLPLQEALKHLNQVAATRSVFSTLEIFNWEADSDAGIGGQTFAITPYLERAAIAVFVFKERVGAVTWEELNNCRSRPIERRIPTFALFPSAPPSAGRLISRDVAHSWADLLDRRNELTEDWTHDQSRSVTPTEPYRDEDHLKAILLQRLSDLLPSLVVKDLNQRLTDMPARELADAVPSSNYLDSTTPLARSDPEIVQLYRSMLRREARLILPAELSDEEFLHTCGYERGGRLTIAGALLFSRQPSTVIPSALVRCSKYDGDNKATPRTWRNCDGPLLDQIVQARDFIGDNIGHRERPVDSSMRSTTSYEYPMVCVREILANAVCHRDYEDQERMIYVTLYNNRIEIKSPGSWVNTPVPEGKLLGLTALIRESVQRNMRLAHAISSVGMMEVEGSGIPTATRDCMECQAPEPTVESREGYVVVTIYPRENWDDGFDGDSPAQGIPSLEATLSTQQSPDVPHSERVKAPAVELDFSKIIGRSEAMQKVLRSAELTASTNATVLITGESGTGKELLAIAIHNASARSGGPFIAVNCGALSPELIQSELFGHVKGAFSGAAQPRQGLFELADGGTLLLDEVGSLPQHSQVQLLRVLQEGTVRRLGSNRTTRVDVRIIAATNLDLEKMVEDGAFRRDVYSRLNVIRLTIPPLRERKEDISALVAHFVKRSADRYEKPIESVSPQVMQLFENYEWPGNIRELENLLAHAVLLSSGTVLDLTGDIESLLRGRQSSRVPREQLENKIEGERERIKQVLEATGWRIAGPKGAATLLGFSPSTLRTRIKKLKIVKPNSAVK